MPVPKRKRSRARRDSRFANKGMVMHAITSCKNCESPLLPHTACAHCGFYRGVQIMTTKTERKAKRVVMRQAVAKARGKRNPSESSESTK